jgi:hypothetical protein
MRGLLYIAGAVIEVIGIVLVGSPDLFPQARRLSNWTARQYWRVANRLLRLIGRPRHVTVQASAGGAVALGGSIMAVVSVSPEATLEEKVAFLLRRDLETQRGMDRLLGSLTNLERDTTARLESARSELEGHVTEALVASHAAYLPLRIAGVGVILIGLGLATTGNFVH